MASKTKLYTSRLVKKHRRALNARRGLDKTKEKEAALERAFSIGTLWGTT